MTTLMERIKARGGELGFSMVGNAPAEPSPHIAAYLNWIKAGMHGTMGYMARDDRVKRRLDLRAILPGARTLIVAALDYTTIALPQEVAADPARGRVSNYAWGIDYHDIMLPRLEALAEYLRVESGAAIAARAYVDTGALLERSHAQRAGLGFTGKNTMLIHPQRGSFFFLGEIITDAALDGDKEDTVRMPGCGTCTRCLSACPTGAFPQPCVLDARLCISYLTIEHKGFIPRDLRSRMGNWVYGCDVCQMVCPWRRFAQPTPLQEAFGPPDLNRAAPPVPTLLALTDETFTERFGGSPIARIKRERLVRNACVAAGNSALPDLAADLLPLLDDPSPLIRGHAGWALGRLGTGGDALRRAAAREFRSRCTGRVAACIECVGIVVLALPGSGIITLMADDNKHTVQEQFGASAAQYVTSALHAHGDSLARLVALTDPQPGWRVLDIATGGGHTALAFAPHVRSVTAGDLTHQMLLAARGHITDSGASPVSYCQHAAEQLPFADAAFDCVTCRIAPHHFVSVTDFVHELVRVLKPGGLLAVADNVVSGEPAIAQFVNALEKLRDPSHNWAYALEDWETFFFSAGLTLLHRETFQKTVDFDDWAGRMRVRGDDLTRLRALLAQAPKAPRAWLDVTQIGVRLTFKLTEGIVVGRKQ